MPAGTALRADGLAIPHVLVPASIADAAADNACLVQVMPFIGGPNNYESCFDTTGTGYALQLSNSSPLARSSCLRGGPAVILQSPQLCRAVSPVAA